jgi:uncharacterized protein (TIGR03437 family)
MSWMTPSLIAAGANHRNNTFNFSRRLRTISVPLAALVVAPLMAVDAAGQQWFSAWTAAPSLILRTSMNGNSVRMIVRPTIAGSAVRVRLENALGQTSVVFSAAYIGQVQSGAALAPGTNTPLTFNGRPGLTLAAGAGAYSDPLTFRVVAFTRYAISLDVTTASEISGHTLGLVTNYMAVGAHAADPTANAFTAVPNGDVNSNQGPQFPFYWVAAMDVASSSNKGTVVTLGDSITDGYCSTRTNNGAFSGVEVPDMYNRWPDLLAMRFAGLPANQSKAVANEGISGNTVVPPPLAGPPAVDRLDNDVLARAGATHVILFEGTNDIGSEGAASATVIAGDQQIIDRVHTAGLKIIGVTLIPRGGEGAWTSSQEQQRVAVNDWIRTQANFDGLIDFDKLMQGSTGSKTGAPAIPPQWSCWDGVHPNAAGYAAMSASIDLSLFQLPGAATVNAASYDVSALSSGGIATLYGTGLSDSTASAPSANLPDSLAGVSVTVQDTAGTTQTAPLYFVSSLQISFVVPAGLANGKATVAVLKNSSPVASTAVQLTTVAPGLFSANASGKGVAAAYFATAANPVIYAFACGNTAGSCVSAPFDLSTAPGGAALVLYGTGIRNNTGLSSTTVTIGGLPATVVYAGPQNQYPGLDQINVQVPPGLGGEGEVDVIVVVNGRAANTVRVAFK